MSITASKLRENIYLIFDEVLETGIPVGIVRRGKKLNIVPASPPPSRRLDRLKRRSKVLVGNPEELVHMDWSSGWKPQSILTRTLPFRYTRVKSTC